MNQYASKDEQVEMIQLSIQQAKEKIELMDSLEALDKNKHFKKVFKEYFLKNYALRLLELKASPAMQNEVNQKFIVNTLDAIGQVSQFMCFITQEGLQAKKLVEQNENELDILATEED